MSDEPQPIPIEELERRFPPELGFKVGHGTHICSEVGEPRSIRFAYVETPDGERFEFFPKSPPGGPHGLGRGKSR